MASRDYTHKFAENGSRSSSTSEVWQNGWVSIVGSTSGIPTTQQFNEFGYYFDDKCNDLKGMIDTLTANLGTLTTTVGTKANTSDLANYSLTTHNHDGSYVKIIGDKADPTKICAKTVNVSSNRTLSSSDASCFLLVSSSSAVTITIPSGTIDVDTEIEVFRAGQGTVTIAAAQGVTLNGATSTSGATASKSINVPYSTCILKKVGTNTWVAAGDIT